MVCSWVNIDARKSEAVVIIVRTITGEAPSASTK